MRTRSFDFFCVPEEMHGALAEAVKTIEGMSIFNDNASGSLPLVRTDLEKITVGKPKLLWIAANVNQPESFLGLIRVSLPQYKNNILCMSSIAIKANNCEEAFRENIDLYEQLRKILRCRLKSGVWGINRATGGEHFYRDVYISEAAISQFRSGRELAPGGGDGFVRFEYRDHDAGRAGATAR